MPSVRIYQDSQAEHAKRLIDEAERPCLVTIRKLSRSVEQNDLMWVLLGQLAKQQPQGRKHIPDVWKSLCMQACNHEIMFEHSLVDGSPFPLGFRSSKLTVPQMTELIEFIYFWGSNNNVIFSEKPNGIQN